MLIFLRGMNFLGETKKIVAERIFLISERVNFFLEISKFL
jgi:hypothetical protein